MIIQYYVEGSRAGFGSMPRAPWTSIVNDAELERLTVKELQALKLRVDDAIRASIRAKRLAKMAPAQAAVAPDDAPKLDLERERDAWLSARS